MFLSRSKKTAVIYEKKKYSFDDLLININVFSKRINIGNGERVLIVSENRPEWIFSFYAIWKNGGIPVPFDFMSTSDEIAYVIDDCAPAIILCSRETLSKVNEALTKTGSKPGVMVFEDVPNSDEHSEPEDFPEFNKDDTAVIIYTSGTTGNPKGVMLTYDNLLANVESVSGEVEIYKESDFVLVLLPLHHIFPLNGSVILPLSIGATCVMCPSLAADVLLKTLQENKVTMIIGVPRLYVALMKGIMDKINSSFVSKTVFRIARLLMSESFSKIVFKELHQKFGGAMRVFVCGGAPLEDGLYRDMRALGMNVMNGFGMTEAAPLIACPRIGDVKIGTVGKPILRTEVKIIDGEICCRGRNVMKGYYNRPEETAEMLSGGWLHTGDLGEIDSEGYVVITGRKKDIIVLPNGKNINPVEIEDKLTGGMVIEAAVFMRDNVLHALIRPDIKKMREKEVLNIDEHVKWEVVNKYNSAASSYKKIMKYTLVTQDLPRNRLGKLQRFKLEDYVKDIGGKETANEPDTKEYQTLKKYLESATGKKIGPEDHIEIDLGLDSLEKVGMQAFFQARFGIDITEQDLSRNPTVEKLAVFIGENKNSLHKEAGDINWKEILTADYNVELPMSRFPHIFLKNIASFLVKILFRYKASGLENLPSHPYVLAANHQSHLDWAFVAAAIPNREFRRIYTFAKSKHFKAGYRKFLADRSNIIIMDINRDLHASIQKMAAVIKKGMSIGIFPEGTRSRDGLIGQFKKGFAVLAKETGVPIVPVVITNAAAALPSGAIFLKPFVKIGVEFLPPVYPGDESYDLLSERVKSAISEKLK